MADGLTRPNSEILLYKTEDGLVNIQVRLEDNTVWLTQVQMAELFQISRQTISHHINSIFQDVELEPKSTIKYYLIVQKEGGRSVERRIDFYNLDMIIAIGYRVRSHRGTQFRQWATQRLSDYLVKGFVLDDERLKEGYTLGFDYFDELLERIRGIRASEKIFYRKITDIYITSIDYDPAHPTTKEFFATVQNKLHWAIHKHTAAEIIMERADADAPNMGLTTWKHAPHGKIRKTDIEIAKNYLSAEELSNLNLIVTAYLDFAELQARSRKPMAMADWKTKLDNFLAISDRDILHDAGRVSAEVAKVHAETQYERYDAMQKQLESTQPSSDFDMLLEETKQLEPKKGKAKGDNSD